VLASPSGGRCGTPTQSGYGATSDYFAVSHSVEYQELHELVHWRPDDAPYFGLGCPVPGALVVARRRHPTAPLVFGLLVVAVWLPSVYSLVFNNDSYLVISVGLVSVRHDRPER
jgi:hypothetical protein